jgi:hypothetical protein
MSECKTKIVHGAKCLVVRGDHIREGKIVDALGDKVKVRFFIKSAWFPIKGQEVHVEFRPLT